MPRLLESSHPSAMPPSLAEAAGLALFPTGQHHQRPQLDPCPIQGMTSVQFFTRGKYKPINYSSLGWILLLLFLYISQMMQEAPALMEGMWLSWLTAVVQGLAPNFSGCVTVAM